MMKRTMIILVLGLFIFSACVFFSPSTPTVDPFDAIQTAYIQTLTARPGSSQSTSTLTLTTSSPVPISVTLWFPASATPTPSTTTPIPPTATITPPINTVTQTPVVTVTALTPEQFIRFYYDQINLHYYSLTWSLLSTNFQNSVNGPAQGGHQGYIDFWNTVSRVDILSVLVLSQSFQYSDVLVFARYIYSSGDVTTSDQTFRLIFDVSRNTWLFDSHPPAIVTPTQTPTQTPTRTPTQTPTRTPTRTPTQISVQTPEQFIRIYFDHINLGSYSYTWALLSDRYKNKYNGPDQGGYQGYVDFWNSIHRVQVNSVSVVSQNQSTALVTVNALFIYNNGVSTPDNLTYHLIFNQSRATWLFDAP